MSQDFASQLWAALKAGKLPEPKPSAVTTPKRERSREKDYDPANYVAKAEWAAKECVLIVVRRKCKCGAVHVTPDRVMIGYVEQKLKATRYLPIKPDQLPCSYPRSIKTVEIAVDYCQSCFLQRGFELQEGRTAPAQENEDGNDRPGNGQELRPGTCGPDEGIAETHDPHGSAGISVRGDSKVGQVWPSDGIVFSG